MQARWDLRRKGQPGFAQRAGRRACRPACESLEERKLLATDGYDYIISGFHWSNPSRITYSFAPDGVFWDRAENDLNATFNAKFGTNWKPQIARALAVWQSVANINITQVAEVGKSDYNVVGPGQGDSRFGDIRFGGYDFDDNQTLAHSYTPPPTGYTAAGDVVINTAMPYQIGSDYDFFSVMLHETGISLGLEEPPNPSVVMNTVYGGVRPGLTAGDIAGIQAIYGARQPDFYQSKGQGTTVGNAINVTPKLSANGQATLTAVSLDAIGDTEYFSVVAPSGSGNTLQVSALAAGVSMLSPKLTLLDASGNVLGTASNPSAWNDNVSTTFTNVVPGQRYVIAVTGATKNVFAVGGYHLQVTFPNAVAPPPSGGGTPAPAPRPTPSPTPTPTPSGPTPVVNSPKPPVKLTPYQLRQQAMLRARQALLNRIHARAAHQPVVRGHVSDRIRK